MENTVGVLAPNLLKELCPEQARDEGGSLLFPQRSQVLGPSSL